MEIAIGIVGVLLAWIVLRYTVFGEPKEQKETLLAHFQATQLLSKDVSNRVFKLA
jgi:hypothetical protein